VFQNCRCAWNRSSWCSDFKVCFFRKMSDFCYTSRLSTQNGEICLQKYPPVSGQSINHKLFETKCFWLSTSFGHRKSVEGRKKGISENKQNSLPRKTRMGTSIGIYNGAKRTISPKSLAHLVILCFERRCWKQNTVARLIKVKRFARRKFVGWLRR